MRIEQILIAIVIFGIVIVTGFNIFAEQISVNHLPADNGKLSSLRDQLDVKQDEAIDSSTRSKVTGELDPDSTTEDSMFRGGYTSIKDISSATVRAGNITNYVVAETGIIPAYVGNAFKVIISILATAFIIYMVFRFKPQ